VRPKDSVLPLLFSLRNPYLRRIDSPSPEVHGQAAPCQHENPYKRATNEASGARPSEQVESTPPLMHGARPGTERRAQPPDLIAPGCGYRKMWTPRSMHRRECHAPAPRGIRFRSRQGHDSWRVSAACGYVAPPECSCCRYPDVHGSGPGARARPCRSSRGLTRFVADSTPLTIHSERVGRAARKRSMLVFLVNVMLSARTVTVRLDVKNRKRHLADAVQSTSTFGRRPRE